MIRPKSIIRFFDIHTLVYIKHFHLVSHGFCFINIVNQGLFTLFTPAFDENVSGWMTQVRSKENRLVVARIDYAFGRGF